MGKGAAGTRERTDFSPGRAGGESRVRASSGRTREAADDDGGTANRGRDRDRARARGRRRRAEVDGGAGEGFDREGEMICRRATK